MWLFIAQMLVRRHQCARLAVIFLRTPRTVRSVNAVSSAVFHHCHSMALTHRHTAKSQVHGSLSAHLSPHSHHKLTLFCRGNKCLSCTHIWARCHSCTSVRRWGSSPTTNCCATTTSRNNCGFPTYTRTGTSTYRWTNDSFSNPR